MIKALSLADIDEKMRKRHEYGEQCIVGIMLARYSIHSVQTLIDENYIYWDTTTDRDFDVFWCGYGEYAVPEGMIEVRGMNHSAYFDTRKFVECTQVLDGRVRGEYNDNIQLILVNYREGHLRYNESVRINLEKNFGDDPASIRRYMQWLLNKCKAEHDVASLLIGLGKQTISEKLHDITLSDLIGAVSGIKELFS